MSSSKKNHGTLANTVQTLQRRTQVHQYRGSDIGTTIQERALHALTLVGKNPTQRIAYNALSILTLGKQIHQIPHGTVFYSHNEMTALRQGIQEYPSRFGEKTGEQYFREYVQSHENPKIKWGTEEIIGNIFSGEVLYSGAISVGKIEIGEKVYLLIGHDKNYNQGRAKTEDHKKVIEYLKNVKTSNYNGVLFIVDTPGADSGKAANETHQAGIMSELITTVSCLEIPTMTLLSGEGGSGGAEVFFGTDIRIGLEKSYFATIHPIGHSAIRKGEYSPQEIVWLLGVDAPELYDKGVIDVVGKISLKKGETSENIVRAELSQMIENTFAFIKEKTGNDPEKLLFWRGVTLRQKTAAILLPRTKEISEKLALIQGSIPYQKGGVQENFDRSILGVSQSIRTQIQKFFLQEFDASRLTKFNIADAIDTLIEHVGSSAYSEKYEESERNNHVGSIRLELYNYQAFFWTLAVLIDPRNYDRFFSSSGTHAKRLVAKDENGLSYNQADIAIFLREIYDSMSSNHVHNDYETWKTQYLSWLHGIMGENMDDIIELTKRFKQVHYDLPDTIVSLTLLLCEKFIESVKNPEYTPTLSGNTALVIDFHAKAVYEQIRFYEAIRKQIFGKCTFTEIQRKLLAGGFTETNGQFHRAHITVLQDRDKLEKQPSSSVKTGWGRIGYMLGEAGKERYRTVDELFGVIMIDFSIEGGAIDGAAAANIIRLIEEAARKEQPLIMFLQSAGMYVDGGPGAVSSMTAINFAIAEYFRKTKGNKKCQIFSVPLGVCTGGTIASFAQAPGVTVLPLSLSDIPFAGRIVTLDQLPLESTLADLQVGKGNIHTVVQNPFISEATSSQIYEVLRNRGISVNEPEYDLVHYLSKYLGKSSPHIQNEGMKYSEKSKTNEELFHPYKKVAILNRGTIASKAIKSLKSLGRDYVVVTTLADEKLPYVTEAKMKGKATYIGDYMQSEIAIIQVIKDSGCDAIYLGYGFWSERDSFIKLCEDNGIVVIGPNSSNVKQMGDKITARQTFKTVLNQIETSMEEKEKYAPAKGSDDILGGAGILKNAEQAVEVARKIGYPVMIKAVYGGGGKGIARIENDTEMMKIFDTMSRTAIENFGNGSMYMEKALENQRHIEVQVFRDIDGNSASLGVRDCTTQRNRQKIIEETGDLGIDIGLLGRLQDIAVAVAKNIGYVGAGTFEFLYDPEKQVFTFMEMNTRIQVEHTITERLIQDTYDKDINLVTAQFEVAEGKTPKFLRGDNPSKIQEAVQKKGGHVMEVRICAEDPAREFAGVSMAKISSWQLNLPKKLKKYVHFETFLSQKGNGINHTSKYDSMIGQLIVSGKTREEARRNMIEALESLHIHGIPTNQEFALRILKSDAFRDRELRISSMDAKPSEFFEGLTPYTEAIDSISELREDSVVLEEGEYIIRMDQDAKITKIPSHGTIFSENEEVSLFELSLSKVNTAINPRNLSEEGKFYIKDHTGKKISSIPHGSYQIVSDRINLEERSYNRGKALIVIRPIL